MVSKLPVSLLQPALLVGQQASILLAVSFFFLFKKRKGNFKRITFKFFNRRAFLSWDMDCSILLIVSSDRSGCSQTFNCCLITKVKVSWPTFSFFFQCLGWSGQRMNSWGNKQQQTTATSYRLISTVAAEQKNGALAGASGALREKVGCLIPANKTSRHSEHNCIRSQKCQELPELYHHWKISPASPTYKQFLCFCFICVIFFRRRKKSAALYHNWDDGLSINKKK